MTQYIGIGSIKHYLCSPQPICPVAQFEFTRTLQYPRIREMTPALQTRLRLYAELTRLTKPIGILIIMYPFLLGFLFTLISMEPIEWTLHPPQVLHTYIPMICLFSIFWRSFGCVWDDIVDARLDAMVERTRTRPLAQKAISILHACIIAAALLFLAVSTTSVITPHSPNKFGLAIYLAPQIIMTLLYPFGKRVSYYTSFWLGFTISWSIFVGARIAGFDIFSHFLDTRHLLWISLSTDDVWLMTVDQSNSARALGLTALFVTYAICTAAQDIIYGFQDIRDDAKLGLKSFAILLGHGPTAKRVLSVLVVLQVAILGSIPQLVHSAKLSKMNTASPVGDYWVVLKASWIFIVFAVVGKAIAWMVVLQRVDLGDVHSTGFYFSQLSFWVQGNIVAGLASQYALIALLDDGAAVKIENSTG
ncbi:unnamed protein product [Periconia digitata]|uniref:Uncharacterized protein n=1 Tax=Periconia digitata TaxID=1303443 RepID=A0A9W4XT53_9PLEO|nr:unnamed protein product [Periconia digitata]